MPPNMRVAFLWYLATIAVGLLAAIVVGVVG
jgi:hypothetical protein